MGAVFQELRPGQEAVDLVALPVVHEELLRVLGDEPALADQTGVGVLSVEVVPLGPHFQVVPVGCGGTSLTFRTLYFI